jgi:hypothetical protein
MNIDFAFLALSKKILEKEQNEVNSQKEKKMFAHHFHSLPNQRFFIRLHYCHKYLLWTTK